MYSILCDGNFYSFCNKKKHILNYEGAAVCRALGVVMGRSVRLTLLIVYFVLVLLFLHRVLKVQILYKSSHVSCSILCRNCKELCCKTCYIQ